MKLTGYQDVTSLKTDVGAIKISVAVMNLNSRLTNLGTDIKEVKTNSNRWLFTLFGIYILKEGYDRYEGPRNNTNNPTIPQQTPTVVHIYNYRPDKAQEFKGDNAAGETVAVYSDHHILLHNASTLQCDIHAINKNRIVRTGICVVVRVSHHTLYCYNTLATSTGRPDASNRPVHDVLFAVLFASFWIALFAKT